MKDCLKVLAFVLAVTILVPGCSRNSASNRSPINGWHKREHRDAPAGYHTNGAKSTPF